LLEELKAIAGPSVARRIDVARTLAGAEDIAGARAILDQLLAGRLTPGERVAVAEQLSSIGATDSAIEQIQLLIDEEKDAPELYEWQGDLFLQTQNAYRARVAYEKALESPRQRSAGLVAKLGNALADLGEKDAALARFAEATRLDPSYRYPYTRAAEVLLAQGKEGEAATALVNSVGTTGDAAQDALNQARALERAGLLSYAATIVAEGLAKDPQNLALQLGLARLMGAGGRHDDARKRLQDILATQPGVAQAWVELARVEAAAGDEAAAIAALDQAEPVAGPQVTETVRTDKTLAKGGPDSALARRAAAFQGRGQARAQSPTQRSVEPRPAGTP
jgi:predicted Zn-dependent protease